MALCLGAPGSSPAYGVTLERGDNLSLVGLLDAGTNCIVGSAALSLSVGDTCSITLLPICRPSYTKETPDPV